MATNVAPSAPINETAAPAPAISGSKADLTKKSTAQLADAVTPRNATEADQAVKQSTTALREAGAVRASKANVAGSKANVAASMTGLSKKDGVAASGELHDMIFI